MRVHLTLLTGLLTLGLSCPARAQNEAEKIVEQAIATQGGRAMLAAIGDVKLRLKIKALSKKDSFEAELIQLYRGPDHLSMVTRKHMEADVIKVYDGTKGSFMRRGAKKTLTLDKRDLAQMREALARARLLLLPNLFVEGAKFELLSKTMIYKVRWTGPKGQVMELHLRHKTYLLKKAYFGRDRATEARFKNFRQFDAKTGEAGQRGIRLPTEVAIYQKEAKAKKPVKKAVITLVRVGFDKKFAAGIFADPRAVAKYIR